jgi:hypothetical protein
MVPDSLLRARNSLYDSLRRGEPQKLCGAVQGPDFIRDSNKAGVYLPAYVRYARGQFMTSLEGELQKALDLDRGHQYLVQWCRGKQLKDIFGGELLMVNRPIDLVLRFSVRP